jgi:hypothetical protein
MHNRSGIESFKNVSSDDSSFLEEVADLTGGARFRISDAAELRKAFARVPTEFHALPGSPTRRRESTRRLASVSEAEDEEGQGNGAEAT